MEGKDRDTAFTIAFAEDGRIVDVRPGNPERKIEVQEAQLPLEVAGAVVQVNVVGILATNPKKCWWITDRVTGRLLKVCASG